jgi:choline dehydrogenase-like flavoprotein
VGGTTWHWNAVAWRFLPNDFKLKSRYGVGRDWPIDYDTLEPYYYQAEVELGVAGLNNIDLGSPRAHPFPMDPVPLSWLDLRTQEILGGQGWKVIPDTVARNSRSYDGRPACCGNNTCAPICPIGVQYAGADTVVKAEAAGARLLENAVVYRIELGADGRVVALHYKDPNGTSHRVTGRYFVLAANGIEIPKLMLMSTNDRFPHGVRNSSDMVGRNLLNGPSRQFGHLPGQGTTLAGTRSAAQGDQPHPA